MNSKIVRLLILFLVAIMCFATIVFADDDYDEDYTRITDGVVGGAIYVDSNEVDYCDESITSVKIPDGITTIGDYAFANCESLKSVTIPDSVTQIGERAFGNCSSLKNLYLPKSVSFVDVEAFSGCTKLNNLTFYDNIEEFDGSNFDYCKNLTVHILSTKDESELYKIKHPNLKVKAGKGNATLTWSKVPYTVKYWAFHEYSKSKNGSIRYAYNKNTNQNKVTFSKLNKNRKHQFYVTAEVKVLNYELYLDSALIRTKIK